MTKLKAILERMNKGDLIPGTITGKAYTFIGIEKYSGRGKYSNLKDHDVIIITSNERKRSTIKLFLETLLLFVNAPPEELTYGKLPKEYMKMIFEQRRNKPNLNEYENHYKALARYIQSCNQQHMASSCR